MDVTCSINGSDHRFDVDGHESFVEVLRDQLGLTGTKLVCGSGVCGACTVQLDETPVNSCLLPATAVQGRSVVTVEGIGAPLLHPVQRAFAAHDGLQCGYCTPGFVVEAAAFVDRWRKMNGDTDPGRYVVADALAGHLCRCAAYPGIDAAVRAACQGEHDIEGTNADTQNNTAQNDTAVAVGPRYEAHEKVTGAARYTTDVSLPDQLEGVIFRSAHAHARIGKLSFESCITAGAHGGVELLGVDRTVRFLGQAIAAVAAPTREAARNACQALDVPYTVLSSVIGPAAAGAEGAAVIYESRAQRKAAPSSAENPLTPAAWNGNVRGPGTIQWRGRTARKRIDNARRQGHDRLTEFNVSTGVQVHTPLEPHACVADWSDPKRLRVWMSTQGVHHAAHLIAEHTGLARDQVEVIAHHVGGGFGAKLGLTTEAIAAIALSQATRKPVRVVYDRREELSFGGLRPATQTRIAMLADANGVLSALDIETRSDGGVSIGTAVASLAALVYGRTPRIARDFDVVSNTPPGTPFRGPGGPPAAWALEQAVDDLAHRMNEDPIALRRRWDGNQRRKRLYDWAATTPAWSDRVATGSQNGRFRRGVGVAAANWFYFVDPASTVSVAVRNGQLVVSTATQDMGTGSRSVLARQVAEVFDLTPHDVVVDIGESSQPHGPASGGSRTTVSIASTAREAAEKLKAKLPIPTVGWSQVFGAHEGATASATRGRDRGIRPLPFTVRNIQMGRQFSGAVHVSDVEVDTRTGVVRVRRVYGGLAVGHIFEPALARAQAESSIIQGIGFALYEQRHLDPNTGAVLSANLEDYRIPQLGDTPEITIHFDQSGWDHVPGGGVGLGEVATLGVAASVGNAIYNATGWRALHLPVRPDRVLEGLA